MEIHIVLPLGTLIRVGDVPVQLPMPLEVCVKTEHLAAIATELESQSQETHWRAHG